MLDGMKDRNSQRILLGVYVSEGEKLVALGMITFRLVITIQMHALKVSVRRIQQTNQPLLWICRPNEGSSQRG